MKKRKPVYFITNNTNANNAGLSEPADQRGLREQSHTVQSQRIQTALQCLCHNKGRWEKQLQQQEQRVPHNGVDQQGLKMF